MSILSKPVLSILVVQTKFLGDLIIASSLSRSLQHEFPEAHITFLCEASFDNFLIAHGVMTDSVTFRRSRMRGKPMQRLHEFYLVARKLRRRHFDLIIDLTDSKTSHSLLGFARAGVRVGYDPPEKPMRMWERQKANVLAKPFGFGGEHFIYRYLSPLEALGIEPRETVPRFDPLPQEAEAARALLAEHGVQSKAFIAVHAGASFPGRCWQPEKFAAAMDEINQRTGLPHVLVGGPDEKGIAEAVLAEAKSPIVDLVGRLSLNRTLPVLQQARLFLGNESGPMHMAASVGTPVVGLFGLIDPAVWGPVGVANIAVRPSQPCPCIAREVCKWPSPGRVCCVWRLEEEEVCDAVCALLQRT
jgi:heptosyltransferase-3